MTSYSKRIHLGFFVITAVLISILACDKSTDSNNGDSNQFSLHAPYAYIRSHNSGGGVMLAELIPGEEYSGNVTLSLNANQTLNAQLDKTELSEHSSVVEITIRPNQAIEETMYEMKLIASNDDHTDTLKYDIEILTWPSGTFDYDNSKRDEFIPWLESEHSEFGSFTGREWFTFATYPQILVVSHVTFLDDDWEVRLCYHVTIPPYDWSYIRLRRRGEVVPIFAAKRETDGTIYEVPISEYPTMFED